MHKKRNIRLIGIMLIILIFINGCSLIPRPGVDRPKDKRKPHSGDTLDNEDEEFQDNEPEKGKKGTTIVKISAVGDIMAHLPQVNAALRSNGEYNFRDVFEEIKPYFDESDIVIGNLETTISTPEKGYKGYPTFKTPEELLDGLKYAGFNILTTANNHSFDGREFGVEHTINKLDEYGLLHTGTFLSQDMREQTLLIEKNDIKIAVLAYTYGTNGMEVTISNERLPYMVSYDHDFETIKEDINRAKALGAELIIVSVHWGWEYVRKPNDIQKELADNLFSAGVDVILGSHPHVLQPMEKRKITLPDGTEKEGLVIYSLGNFISNQRDQYRDSGIVLNLEVIKDYDRETISLGSITYVPTWVHKYIKDGQTYYSILPAGKYKNGGLEGSAKERIQAVWSETTSHMGDSEFEPIE